MIKYKTNAFIFLEFLQPILIIFIMAFTTSCQSDKTNSNNENTGKIVFVANTSQDNESPWLAFRDEPKYDGKLISLLFQVFLYFRFSSKIFKKNGISLYLTTVFSEQSFCWSMRRNCEVHTLGEFAMTFDTVEYLLVL